MLLALGQTPAGLRALVVRNGLGVVLAGTAGGILVAAATTPVLRRMLFGVGMFDPFVYGGVPLLLITVAIAACW